MKPIARWSSFIAEMRARRASSDPFDDTLHALVAGINLTEKPHLAATATICHGNRVAQLCDINPDENLCMLLHGPPSCAEDRLGHSEQPSKAQCRANHSRSADIWSCNFPKEEEAVID